MAVEFRPPTPGMKGRELDQWLQRVYEALKQVIEAAGGIVVISDHNDLTNNGGSNSHTSITNHIASSQAHGLGSDIVGENDSQTLTNKAITGSDNSISGLRHGIEVDNSSSGVHGVSGDVVGTIDSQILTNKSIIGSQNSISGMRHGVEVDDLAASVHGVIGVVVGTGNQQLLWNKTLKEVVTTAAANYTVLATDWTIRATVAAIIITLFDNASTAYDGQAIRIDNASTGDITVLPHAGGSIQGEASQTVPPNCCMEIQASGNDWRII